MLWLRQNFMRVRTSVATLLLRLPLEQDEKQQAAGFRQALTALAQAVSSLGPPVLDGVDASALEAAAQLAIGGGLTQDLSFIDPGSAAVALYELSSALPAGQTRRDLRRTMFSLLYRGNASAFVPVATRIALGSAGPLATPTLKARLALSLQLPLGSSVNVGPLALALVTRSATHQHWAGELSTGALAARKTAALLYEHAARQAMFSFQQGDPLPLERLLDRRWGSPLQRLLFDREPLVWHHAASAWGLLASVHPETKRQVEQGLDPALTITQWRRSAVALVASTALGDEETHRSVLAVLQGPLHERDRGLRASMVVGLSRVLETEPDLAESLLCEIAKDKSPAVAHAAAELVSQTRDASFARETRRQLRDVLLGGVSQLSRIERAMTAQSLRALADQPRGSSCLSEKISHALLAFEENGAAEAYQAATEAIAEAHELAAFIEANPASWDDSQAESIASLMELDSGAFQRGTLNDLLLLGRAPGDASGVVEQFERLQNRVGRWVLGGVQRAGRAPWSRDGALADQHCLRSLLHLVDSESIASLEAGVEKADPRPLSNRVLAAIQVLLRRLADGPDALVHRVLCAALARSFDAAVRHELLVSSDLLLVVLAHISDEEAVTVMSEASTTADVARPLAALSAFMGPSASDSLQPALSRSWRPGAVDGPEMADSLSQVDRLMTLSRGLVGGGGYHAEALRRVFSRIGRSLSQIAVARGQSELLKSEDSGTPILEELSLACEQLAAMVRGATRRVLGVAEKAPPSPIDEAGLYEIVERGIESERPPHSGEVNQAVQDMVVGVPEPVARIIEQVSFRIERLPQVSDEPVRSIPLIERKAALPQWLLPRRAIGSFFVVRPLGAGGVSSVFLARRLEDRNHPGAQAFALKVPEYDPATARSLSEQEFFQMFRDEAGALLSLPSHDNLARFVTFDLSARPKPILVMELIQGTPLDRLVRSKALTMPKVLAQLDGILAGLEAMHAVDVGHLDVKPSNVILQNGNTPVLVDFGLSGRALRPGCGTLEYTSPEVLGVFAEGSPVSPMKADIYSFGCLMYEMLTGKVLFQGPDEMSLVSRHVAHDGWVPELAKLASVKGLERLSNLIGSCLRRDGKDRPSASELRNELTPTLLPLTEISWPLTISS